MNSCDRRRYIYFNHTIESDLTLPELIELIGVDEQNVLPDVSFQVSADQSEFTRSREWLHHWKAPDQSDTLSFARDNGTLFLHFPEMARFTIRNNGHLVTCHARPSLSLATIRHLLLDQVLPRLFAHFYSSTVFHASFLSVHGKGICFLADSGWGKSTIAAGLGAAGNIILTDDCLGIAVQDNQVIGIPAYYGIRLLPDSIDNLGDSFKFPGEAVAEYTSKKRIPLKPLQPGTPKALPLQALFLLASPQEGKDCKTPKISLVGGAHAIKVLLKNSFCLDVQDQQWQKDHFMRVSQLAASGLPIFSLCYPRKYQSLPEVVKAIMDTLDQLSPR